MSRHTSASPFQNTEQASAWLREQPWGGALLRQLRCAEGETGAIRWLQMVGDMYRVFHGAGGPPSMFDYDDEDDVRARHTLAAP